jgi:hypothetical protein
MGVIPDDPKVLFRKCFFRGLVVLLKDLDCDRIVGSVAFLLVIYAEDRTACGQIL